MNPALLVLGRGTRPRLDRTVEVADRIRRAVMSRTTWLDDEGRLLAQQRPLPDPQVAGKDAAGNKLEGHRHAFWLPFSEDPTARNVDAVLVWLRGGGLTARTLAALKGLERVWAHGQPDIEIAAILTGPAAEERARSLLGPAARWVSETPFVPTRHPKPGRQRDSIEDQVLRGLAQLDLPTPRSVQTYDRNPRALPWSSFRTTRAGGGAKASPRGCGIELIFERPISGPIALGWGAHFGMGRFAVAP